MSYYPSYGPGTGSAQPDMVVASAAVSRMSLEELRALLDDDHKCELFVKGLDQVQWIVFYPYIYSTYTV